MEMFGVWRLANQPSRTVRWTWAALSWSTARTTHSATKNQADIFHWRGVLVLRDLHLNADELLAFSSQ
jgi:hypothetical protein